MASEDIRLGLCSFVITLGSVMLRRWLVWISIAAFPVVFLIALNLSAGWDYSETRLKGLSEAEVIKLLGVPPYAGSHGRLSTSATQRDPYEFYFVYYNHEGRQVHISFENGRVAKVKKLHK